MMQILVLGGNSYVGQHIIKFLSRSNYLITATYNSIKKFSKSETHNVVWKKFNVKTDLIEKLGNFDVIVNLIAVHPNSLLKINIADYIKINIEFVNDVKKFAIKNKTSLIIHFSSISAIGNFPSNELKEIKTTFDPPIYGASKFLSEIILNHNNPNLRIVIFRPPGIVGRNYFKTWIGKTFLKLKNNEDVVVYNTNTLFNNITDVEEISKFVKRSIQSKNISGLLNIGSKNPIPIYDVINLMKSFTNSKSNINYIEDPSKPSFFINIDKLKKLGFEISTTKKIIRNFLILNKY